MESSSKSPEIEPLKGRTFAFAPPIRNVDNNQWQYRQATWSEVLVASADSGREVWIPRRLLGQITGSDDALTVELLKELEYKAGAVWPIETRKITPPALASNTIIAPIPATPPAHPRYAEGTESRIGRMILIAFCLLVGAGIVTLGIMKLSELRPVTFTSNDQDFLALSRHDDFFAVTRKLGRPMRDQWSSATGALQYRALWYPHRGYYVVLMGTDRNDARYIGTLDRDWRVVHYVELPNGSSTSSLLRAVPKFCCEP